MKSQMKFLLGMVTVLLLIVQSMQPVTVYADGETTLPPEETAIETSSPDPTDIPEITETPVPAGPTAEPVETDVPVPPTDPAEAPTELAEGIQSTPETVEPVATEMAIEELSVTEVIQSMPETAEPVATEVASEVPSIAEVLQEIPEGIDIVALDENGEPEPLATQEAAEIIATGDPIWCPDGVAPTPGSNGCSISFGTLSGLVSAMEGTVNQNGTIWITSGSVADTSPILIDDWICESAGMCDPYAVWSNYSLTLQGGWSGISGDTTIGSNSIFSVPIQLWTDGSIIVNNITISDTAGTGLIIDTPGNVTISNSTFSNNGDDGYYGGGNGVYIFDATNVTISSSYFTGNGGYDSSTDTYSGSGFQIGLANSVTIYGSVFSENSGNGASINNANSVIISGSTFAGNGADSSSSGTGTGLYVSDANNVTISQSTFAGNAWEGLRVVDTSQISIADSSFSGNFLDGLIITEDVYSASNITINNSEFIGNQVGVLFGVRNPDDYPLNLTVSDSAFLDNNYGIVTFNNLSHTPINVTLNCVQFRSNFQDITGRVDGLYEGGFTLNNNPCFQPPPPDRDHDGIMDDDDACPDVPGIRTDNPLTNGCPLQPQLIVVEGRSISFPIDCSLFSSYFPVWPNGDRVLISCVPNGMAVVSRVESTDLVDELGAGYEYASGLNVGVFQAGASLSTMPEGGKIQVSFAAEESDARYGIMYWDESAGEWVLFEEYQPTPSGAPIEVPLSDAEDFRTILVGTQLTEGDPNRASVTTNFLGTYVLVVQE